MRLYGSVELQGRTWVIETEPQVALRIKRVFQKINKNQYGKLTLTANPENTRELKWFLERYPMNVSASDQTRICELTDEHLQTEDLVSRILAGGYEAPQFDMAVQPREYQRISADLAMRTGRLLIADDLGLGKTAQAICTFTNPANLPALVVTLSHLPRQWANEIEKFIPGLRTHVIKKGTPYDVCAGKKGGKNLFPDVLITNYHKLNGWAETLAGTVKTVIYDEIQELRRPESAKYGAAVHVSEQAALKVGLSVGRATRIELFGGPFGTGWSGPIEEAWNMVSQTTSHQEDDSYEIMTAPPGVMSRGWINDDLGFGWKSVKKFIRHPATKPMMRVQAGGAWTDLTTDHSIFIANKKSITERRTDEVEVGNIIPSDTGAFISTGEEAPFDVIAIASAIPRAQIAVDLEGINRRDLGLKAWEWQNCHKEATYGPRVPLSVYLANPWLKITGPVYIGRGKAPALPPSIMLSSWAYVLGFFIGDGWVDKNRASFAVDQPRVEEFIRRLHELNIGLRPEVRKMRGASSEVRVTHLLFVRVLRQVFAGASCDKKRIPHAWMFTWSHAARRALLDGLIDSDGHRSKTKTSAHRYCTTSPGLAEDVRLLLRTFGAATTVNRSEPRPGGLIDGRRIVGRSPRIDVIWSDHASRGMNNGHKGGRHRFNHWRELMNEAPVRSITNIDTDPNSYVYDLEMDGHPSFVANGLLCHNSATPIYNYGGEIFSVISAMEPGVLGQKDEFMREWCDSSIGDRPKIRDPKAFGSYLREQGLMIRRTRSEVGRELEALTKIPQAIEADTDALSKIEDSAAELAKIILSQQSLKKGVKMQAAEQLSNLLRQQTGIAKAPYVADFIRMIVEAGEPVLVFAWHREVYDIINAKLADLGPVMYTGSESATEKAASKEKFLNGESKILLMSLRAGAGLDGLQHVCRTVVFAELDWSPGVHDQGCGRVHRDGQKDPVMAYFLLSDYGSDPVISDVLGVKRAQMQGIRDPNASVIETAQASDHDTRKLAESFLRQRGLEVTEPTNLSNLIRLNPTETEEN